MDVLDAWKNLQSNSKASKDKKIVWVVYKKSDKEIVVDKVMTAADEAKENENVTPESRHKALVDYLLSLGEPRFAGLDFMEKVFFISYIDDKVKVGAKFPYANSREGFKHQLSGIGIDVQANSPGDLSLKCFQEEVAKKSNV